MATSTTSNLITTLPFVADPNAITRHPGRVVDWASVPTTYIPTGGSKKQLKGGTVVGVKNGKWLPCAVGGTVSALVVASNVATVTLEDHGYVVGDVVTVAGSNLAYANISATIATVADADTFTYVATGSNATATGTITARVTAKAILATPAQEGGPDAITGHGALIGGSFYENLLPDATGTPKALPAAYKTELAAAATTGYAFLAYADSATA